MNGSFTTSYCCKTFFAFFLTNLEIILFAEQIESGFERITRPAGHPMMGGPRLVPR